MELSSLRSVLRAHPNAITRFLLPNGEPIPAHFHITEVGHVAKRFIDCGGKFHATRHTCLLQAHVGDDTDHRLTAGRFEKILDLGRRVLPPDDLEVEVEYDCCVAAQYPIETARLAGAQLELQLRKKGTACLAKANRRVEAACC